MKAKLYLLHLKHAPRIEAKYKLYPFIEDGKRVRLLTKSEKDCIEMGNEFYRRNNGNRVK